MKKYKKEVEKRKLQNNIMFLGKRKDVPEILFITNVYVASSKREGLPLNIMEAMYMRLPIVATNNRGHRELIDNNLNGYLIENEVSGFVKKIKEIIKNKKLI